MELTEERLGDALAALHRIERVAGMIYDDKTNSHYWHQQKAMEIKNLARIAAGMLQAPLNNGEA